MSIVPSNRFPSHSCQILPRKLWTDAVDLRKVSNFRELSQDTQQEAREQAREKSRERSRGEITLVLPHSRGVTVLSSSDQRTWEHPASEALLEHAYSTLALLVVRKHRGRIPYFSVQGFHICSTHTPCIFFDLPAKPSDLTPRHSHHEETHIIFVI